MDQLDEVSTTTEANDDDCADVTELSHTRRYLDLACASIGFVLSIVHLIILIYVRFFQKHKGFFLLLIQAIISLLTMFFLIIGCFIDICAIELSAGLTFFRAYIWLYLVNSLIATYGFIIVALCLDRYVALNNPLYYRLCFSTLKVRLLILITCVILGVIVCLKWVVYNQVDDEDTFSVNVEIQASVWYLIMRISSTLLQYVVSGIVMICISISIIAKLKELDRQHFHELRLAEVSRHNWTKNHKTTANICIFLTLSFIVFNWPYALADYFYTEDREKETWYGIIEVVINMSQLLYMQLNIFFFAYCSRIYRHNLYLFLTFAARYLRRTLCCRRGSTQIHNNHKCTIPKKGLFQFNNVNKPSFGFLSDGSNNWNQKTR